MTVTITLTNEQYRKMKETFEEMDKISEVIEVFRNRYARSIELTDEEYKEMEENLKELERLGELAREVKTWILRGSPRSPQAMPEEQGPPE